MPVGPSLNSNLVWGSVLEKGADWYVVVIRCADSSSFVSCFNAFLDNNGSASLKWLSVVVVLKLASIVVV